MSRPSDFPPLPDSLQTLTPAQARFCLGMARFLRQELRVPLAGERLLVGFSGGADSLALLLGLHYLAPGLGFSLHAAHLDHALRPSSAEEAVWCKALCARLGIACHCEQRPVRSGGGTNSGLEDAARTLRYAFFADTAQRFACTWTAVAHTANDLAEDILMRLIRGTGWPALSGMAAVDASRRLLRPLLTHARATVEAFLLPFGLNWVEDESNTDAAYLRNRVRLRLLPLLLEENPSFLDAATGLWRLGRIDAEYFDAQLEAAALRTLPAGASPPDADLPAGTPAPAAKPPAPAAAHPAPAAPPPAPAAETPSGGALPAADPGLSAKNPPPAADLWLPARLLATLPKALRLRLYKKTLALLGPGQALLSGLLALDASWQAGRGRSTHRFPGKKTALVSAKGIRWQRTP